ncbi:MAG TPA: Calx-beta domain-containing protein [Thermoanaerobaculia bacterium]|nr:Calx-beta domain-containing protein [Thermoanaerobaculia bacterium]
MTVDYATSDGTALAGSDYDAASGTLTFAAGETSKSIEVRIRGDVTGESNETFFLTLRNPSGATLQKASAFAIIDDDDDQLADLALSLDLSSPIFADVIVKGTNNGPQAATNIHVTRTTTPADGNYCGLCSGGPPLAAGATAKLFSYRWMNFQQYLTATATIHQLDPQPANNSAGWITNASLAMDALFLTPGSTANVWLTTSNISGVSITSSDPSVISVPSTLAFTTNQAVSFVARGINPGSATIRVFTSAFEVGTIKIDVVPSGTKPRYPGAMSAYVFGGQTFDSASGYSITTDATAPYTAEKPTGVITVSANGHELARVTLDPQVSQQKLIKYLPDLGDNLVRFDYSGDANFLPMFVTQTVSVSTGRVTILGGAERSGTSAKVHVRVTGSPAGAPTGTVTIYEPGVIAAKTVALTAGAAGEGEADVTFTNVSNAVHTLLVSYSGDARYSASNQDLRMIDARLRSVKH